MHGAGCKVQGARCRVQGAGCRVQVAGCRVQGAGCRVQGAGTRLQGAGYRVQGADHSIAGNALKHSLPLPLPLSDVAKCRQPRPDYSLVFQVEVLRSFQVILSWLPSGGCPAFCTLHPAHPAPCSLHTLHPAPCTPCTLLPAHPAPCTLHPALCTLTPTLYALLGCRLQGADHNDVGAASERPLNLPLNLSSRSPPRLQLHLLPIRSLWITHGGGREWSAWFVPLVTPQVAVTS